MILRRIAEAIKRQDWFTVLVEVLIVVFGVFIGIQVANWNEDRKTRTEEQRFIAQLLKEINSEIEEKVDWVALTNTRIGLLESGLATIQSEQADAELSNFQCRAIAFSHIILIRTSVLPTLDELSSSGRLGVLSNPEARNALTRYKSSLAEVSAQHEYISNDIANLIDTYGDAFPRNLVTDGSEVEALLEVTAMSTDISCRLDAIRANQNLRNRIISNLGRTRALANYAEEELLMLREIKSELQETTP